MINAWKLPKHHHLFNALPTEVKENFDTGKLSYEPKNMKRETSSWSLDMLTVKLWMISRRGIKVTEIGYLSLQKLKI